MQSFVDAFSPAGFKAGAFLPSYGLAEATLAVSIMPPGEGLLTDLVEETLLSGPPDAHGDRPVRYRAIVHCGRPVRDMKVERREDDGAVLGDSQNGRISYSGPSVTIAYFLAPEATE